MTERERIQSFMDCVSKFQRENNGNEFTIEQYLYILNTYGMTLTTPLTEFQLQQRKSQAILDNIENEMKEVDE